MKTILEIPVRSTEVDLYGHVNNAKYLEYLEWGREEWYGEAGFTFTGLAGQNIGTVTVNINIDYLGECRIGDLLMIETAPEKIGKSSFVLLQEIFKKENHEKVISARVTTVMIDLEKRKSIPIPGELLNYLQAADL